MAHIDEIRTFISRLGLDNQPFEGGVLVPSENIVIQCVDTSDAEGKAEWVKQYRESCKAQGYRLISIPEYYWQNKPEVVKARLHVTFHTGGRIHADQTRISGLSDEAAKDFLNRYHVEGYPEIRDEDFDDPDPQPYKKLTHLGLITKKASQIVAVMTFSGEEIGYHGHGLIRYATAGTVIKGAERLFKSYLNIEQPETLYADCDLNWETGGIFYVLGFKPFFYAEPADRWISGWDKFIWEPEKSD